MGSVCQVEKKPAVWWWWGGVRCKCAQVPFQLRQRVNSIPQVTSFSDFHLQNEDAEQKWLSHDAPSSTSSSSTHPAHTGPIPTFQNEYGCIQETVYYSANLSALRAHDGVISGNLTDSPCGQGTYFISAIAHTNLFLLVVEDYRSTENPFNFNCHIKNR